MSPSPLQVPEILRAQRRWLRWTLLIDPKSMRPTKVPDCSTNDVGRLRRFETVCDAGPIDAAQGIGFCFTGGLDIDGMRIYALDVDACRDPATGTLEPWAQEIVTTYGYNFTEITPSGTGLRVWLLVRRFPKTFTKALRKPEGNAAPNTGGKLPQVQVFGYGAAQYVTVSGALLPGCSTQIQVVESLDWLIRRFGFETSDTPRAERELPVGQGMPPSAATVRAVIAQGPFADAVLKGDWRSALARNADDESASAAYYRVALAVLKAADGHGQVALDFLLDHTPWGLGLVHDSKDPSKYGRPSWVAAELRRLDAKMPTVADAASVFDDGFDCSSFVPPPGLEPMTDAAPGPETPSGPYRVRSVLDMAADPVPDWIVRGYVPQAVVGLLAGESQTGKSGLAVDLSLHLAHGLDWLGKVTKPCSVLWIAGEGRGDIGPRAEAWHRLHERKRAIDGGRYFASVVDPVDALSAEKGLARLRATIEAQPHQPGLVVLDTMATLWGGENENDAGELGRWLGSLAALANELRVTFLIVHHLNKQPPKRGRQADSRRHVTLDDIRGGSPLAANADFVLAMTATSSTTSDLLNLKQRSAAKAAPVPVEIRPQVVGRYDDGEPVTAMVAVRGRAVSEAQREHERKAQEAETQRATVEHNLRRVLAAAAALGGDSFHTKGALQEQAGMKGTDCRRAVDRATSLGFLEAKSPSDRAPFRLTDKARQELAG